MLMRELIKTDTLRIYLIFTLLFLVFTTLTVCRQRYEVFFSMRRYVLYVFYF